MAKVNHYDPEVMRARFWELQAEIAAIDEKMAPLNEEAAEIAAYKAEREREVAAELKKLNNDRAALQFERGTLANALGGRTGEGPDSPYDGEAVARFHAENPTPQEEPSSPDTAELSVAE